jgi:hypothetical protein
MLIPYDLASDDPSLFEQLAVHKQPPRPESVKNANSKWVRSGPGPVALIGNLWTSGVMLAPLYAASGSSSVSAISYDWDTSKLRLWAPQTNVRLLVTDAVSLETWMSDVTDMPHGNLILPANVRISANCQVIFQMTAGAMRGRLRNPPFIPSHQVTVRYRY